MRRFSANRAGQLQPALPSYQIPGGASAAKELGSPPLLHGLSRRLQNVKLVLHDPALRNPRFQALSERFPHVHTPRSNRASLQGTLVLLEKLVPRFFLSLSSKPERFSALQVRHHRQKLLFLPQVDLVHSHLPRKTGRRRPSAQRRR